LVNKVEVYKDEDNSPIKETTYDYNLTYYDYDQFYNKKTIVNDERTTKKYYYDAIAKSRDRWIDLSDWGAELEE